MSHPKLWMQHPCNQFYRKAIQIRMSRQQTDSDMCVLQKLDSESDIGWASLKILFKQNPVQNSPKALERTGRCIKPTAFENGKVQYRLSLPLGIRTTLRVSQRKYIQRDYVIRSLCTRKHIQILCDSGIIGRQ